MAHLATIVAGEAKARVEDDLARIRDALATTEEDGRGLEVEVARLTVEQTSLLLELQTSRDEVSSLHSQAGKDREAIVKDYHKAFEKIFTYGYGCYVFKHGIHDDRPSISDGMPDSADPLPLEFFANLGCPLAPSSIEGKATEVHSVETTKDSVEGAIIEEQS